MSSTFELPEEPPECVRERARWPERGRWRWFKGMTCGACDGRFRTSPRRASGDDEPTAAPAALGDPHR
jgi:hypothetical protein